MVKVFLALLLIVAPSAQAKIWDGGHSAVPEPRRIVDNGITPLLLSTVRDDIRDGRRAGQISRSKAKSLRREARRIGHVQDRYRTGGFSMSERAELEGMTLALQGLVNAKRSAPSPR